MKKLLFTCIFSIVISLTFANFIFTSYKSSIERIISSSLESEKVYMLLYGSYNSKDKIDTSLLSDYLLKEDDGFYKVYVGITLSLENAEKIKEIYSKTKNSIYVREEYITNLEFLDYVSNKEINLVSLSDNEVLSIEKDIINKYKEIFNE